MLSFAHVLFTPLVQLQQIHGGVAQEIAGLAAALGLAVSVHQSYMVPSEFHPGSVRVDPDEAVGVAAWSAMQLLPDESILRHSPRDGFLQVRRCCLCWHAAWLRPGCPEAACSLGAASSPGAV